MCHCILVKCFLYMQERFEIGVSEQVSQGRGGGGGRGGEVLAPTGDGLVTTASVQSVGFGSRSENDEVILQEHEEAMQRLEELQREMIGGEKAGRFNIRLYTAGKCRDMYIDSFIADQCAEVIL